MKKILIVCICAGFYMLCLPSYGAIDKIRLNELSAKLMGATKTMDHNGINTVLKNIANECGDNDKEYRLKIVRSELIKMVETIKNECKNQKDVDYTAFRALFKDSKILELLINEITNACFGNGQLLLKIKTSQEEFIKNRQREDDQIVEKILLMTFELAAEIGSAYDMNLLLGQTIGMCNDDDKGLLLDFINVEVSEALRIAAYNNNTEVVNLLLCEIVTAYGNTNNEALLEILSRALVRAAYGDNAEVARLLLDEITRVCNGDNGLLLNTISKQVEHGCTLLMAVTQAKKGSEVLKLLLDDIARVCNNDNELILNIINKPSEHGTLLMGAAAGRNADSVKIIFDEIKKRNGNRDFVLKTINDTLLTAIYNDKKEILELFIDEAIKACGDDKELKSQTMHSILTQIDITAVDSKAANIKSFSLKTFNRNACLSPEDMFFLIQKADEMGVPIMHTIHREALIDVNSAIQQGRYDDLYIENSLVKQKPTLNQKNLNIRNEKLKIFSHMLNKNIEPNLK